MAGAERQLLELAADVVCELSAGQVEALASDIETAPAPRRILQVAGLAAPRSVVELSERWIDTPDVDGQRLADALRCAAIAVKTVSDFEKVELVYTGPDAAEFRRTQQALLEVIRGARLRLWVVSYVVGIGVDDVLQALCERAEAGVEVRMLVDHRTERFGDALDRLRADAPGCDLYVWPDEQREFAPGKFANLHAKCAVADGRQAFVTSANLTGWAMDHNLEAGYLVTGGRTPRLLEHHLEELSASGLITACDPA